MLSAFRAFAKSWVAAILIGLLVVSFAVFGITDVFQGRIGDVVIKAGSRTIGSNDYRREFDSYKSRLEQQAQQPVSLDMAVANKVDKQVLEGLAVREAFAETLHRAGIQPSDKLLADQLTKIPAFFDRVSGRFDKATYAAKLAENGLTPARFDQVMRDQLAQTHWQTGVLNGLRVPRAYGALGAIYALEAYDLAWFRLDQRNVPPPPPPTDAQLTAFMQENAAQLTRPEFRVLTVVRFSPAAVSANIPVDEAELKKRYEFRKDTISSPETRTIVQIPARNAGAAQQIGQRLTAGQSPTVVAKAAGVDAIIYEDKPQTAIADRKIAQAAFSMKPGEIAPVRGDLGMSIVQVTAVKPGHSVTFEEARPQLEAELRKDAASEKVYALTQAYDDAHQGGASLTEAAAKAGVPAFTIGPVTKSGQDLQARPVEGLDPKLMETAFNLPVGGESQVEDLGDGEYYAVRVDRIIPPAMPPLAEVKSEIARVWMMRDVARRLTAKAEELAARVRKGESFEAVAASAGVPVVRATGIDRQSAGQNPQLSRDLLGHAFSAKAGEVFVAEDTQFGALVARVDAIRAGDPQALARGAENARPQMSVSLFREMEEAARRSSRTKLKVMVNYDRARTALGLDPEPKDKPPAKPGLAK